MQRPVTVLGLAFIVATFALSYAGPPSTRGASENLTHRLVLPGVAKDQQASAPVPTPSPTPLPTPSPNPTPPPDPGSPPPDAPDSYELINAALTGSQITAEQAAIYRVYAAFSDPRLPAAFKADGELPDSYDLFADIDSLSASAKSLLAPFRVRPGNPDSWWYTTDAGEWPASTGSAAAAASGEVGAAARPPGAWLNVTGTKVRVHYPNVGNISAAAGLAAYSGMILNEAETVVWPALVSLLGQEPPSDCLIICGDFGGSSHYDIYLVNVNRSYVQPEFSGCSAAGSSYMGFNPSRTYGTLAHELMHAFQDSFTMGGSGACGEYLWLQEATAQWAVDYVYKKTYNTYEQRVLPDYLDHPRQPLEFRNDAHEYGAYLFFLYLTRIGATPAVIKSIWSAASNSDSLKAVDGAIPGGFARHWQQFVKYNWNPNPPWAPLSQYRTLDDLTTRVKTQSGAGFTSYVTASPDRKVILPNSELVHVSSAYYEFTFDATVSTLAFLNGFTYDLKIENIDGAQAFISKEIATTEPVKKHGKVQALIKRRGQDWEVADWSNTPSYLFCPDDPNDRVERLVIILSNSDHERANLPIKPVGLEPMLWASNMGCWKWEGTATWINAGGTQSTSANVTWERIQSSGVPGVIPASAAAVGDRFGAIAINYRPVAGTISFRAQGSDGGCTYSGGATFDFTQVPTLTNFLLSNNLVPAGDYHRVYVGGGLTPPVTMTQACPAVSTTTAPRIWLLTVDDSQQSPPLKVSSDGRRMTGRADAEGDVFTWDFKALRGP